MYTTTDERGLLNNFAAEPAVYLAETPSKEQKRRYVFQGIGATVLVSLLALTIFAIH
ncbi:MAG TPA: ssl1498 family light-harvesting-like protein [Candidatus Caenarcaniphilales bacterium]